MKNNSLIYLDNNATTALDPRVIEAMVEELHFPVGNPSSIHSFGREVRSRVIKARRLIAGVLGVLPPEIVFTSGGTETMNMLIRGACLQGNPGHIITSNVEHPCVFRALQHLEELGCNISFLPPGDRGSITKEQVEESIQSDTKLIALMAANNETGVLTDLDGIASLAKKHGIPLIVDGVALFGKESLLIPEGVSAMGFSAHKFHGPKGVGMAFLRQGAPITPFHLGGGQENNHRGGTENVLGIMGLAKAVALVEEELELASLKMRLLRDRLEKGLIDQIPPVLIHGKGPRLSNTTCLSFPGIDGESLLMNLDLAGVAVSHGSACSSGALEPSRVLLNMGIKKEIVTTAIRFSLSRFTTEEEIDKTIEITADIVNRLRQIG